MTRPQQYNLLAKLEIKFTEKGRHVNTFSNTHLDEQRVTEVFLREAVDSIASRSNEKAHLSQRQDPSLPSNRADPLYGANIHLSFCFPVYCAIPAE